MQLVRKKTHWLPRLLCNQWVTVPHIVVEACRVQHDTTTYVRIFWA